MTYKIRNLRYYFGLPENEILKIKLHSQKDFVYGKLAMIGRLGPATFTFSVDPVSSATLSKIYNYDEFSKDPKGYIGHSLLNFNTKEIDSIEILEI